MQEIVLLTDVAFVLFNPFMFFICYSPTLQDDKHIPSPTHSDNGLTLETSSKFYANITLLLIYHLIQGQNHCHLHSFHYLDPPPPHHHYHYHSQQQNCPLPLLPLPPHLPQILHHCFQLLFLSDPHLLHLRDWKCNKWVGIMDTNH